MREKDGFEYIIWGDNNIGSGILTLRFYVTNDGYRSRKYEKPTNDGIINGRYKCFHPKNVVWWVSRILSPSLSPIRMSLSYFRPFNTSNQISRTQNEPLH